jgi:hypothetical protein
MRGNGASTLNVDIISIQAYISPDLKIEPGLKEK